MDFMLSELQRNDLPTTNDASYVVVSRDGSVVVTADNASIRLWDPISLEQRQVLASPEMYVDDVSISPDGRTLAVADWSGNSVHIWDLESGRLTKKLNGHSERVLAVAFTPDGDHLASSGQDHTIKLWHVPSGRNLRTLEGHTRPVLDLDTSPDGTYVVSVSADKTVRVWNLHTGELLSRTSLEFTPQRVAFSPSGNCVAVAGDTFEGVGTAKVGHAEVVCLDRQLRPLFSEPFRSPDRIWAVAFLSPERVTVGDAEGQLTTLAANTGKTLETFTVEDDYWGASPVYSLAFTADALFVAHGHGAAIFRSPQANAANRQGGAKLTTQLFMQHHQGVNALAISPRGDQLVVGGQDGYVGVWDVERIEEVTSFQVESGGITSLTFDEARDRLIASVWNREPGQNSLWIWNLRSSQLPITVDGFPSGVGEVDHSPDGRWFAVAMRKDEVQLRACADPKALVASIPAEAAAAGVRFSPDSRYLAFFAGLVSKHLCIYDLFKQKVVQQISMSRLSGVDSWFVALHWLDSQTVVTGDASGAVRVINTVSGDETARFEDHTDSVYSVAALPDKQHLVSGSWDKTVRLWDLSVPWEVRRWYVDDDVLAVRVGENGRIFVVERSGRVSEARLE